MKKCLGKSNKCPGHSTKCIGKSRNCHGNGKRKVLENSKKSLGINNENYRIEAYPLEVGSACPSDKKISGKLLKMGTFGQLFLLHLWL